MFSQPTITALKTRMPSRLAKKDACARKLVLVLSETTTDMPRPIHFKRLFIALAATVFCMFSGQAQDGLSCYNNGINEYRAGNLEAAIARFTEGIAVNDENVSVNYLGRAICYYYARSMGKAQQDVMAGLQNEAQNSAAVNGNLYYTLGLLLNWIGDKPDAAQAFHKALNYGPDDPAVKTGYALSLLEMNRPAEALTLLNTVIEANKKDAFALNNRGLAYYELGDPDAAKRDLDAALELDATNPFLFKNYYLVYKAQNNLKQACEALQTALRLDMGYYGNPEEKKLWQEWWLGDCGVSKE